MLGISFILVLSLKHYLFLNIVRTPRFEEDKAPTESFSRLQNVSSPVLTNLSTCLWVSMDLGDLGVIWSSEKAFFSVILRKKAKYIVIGGVYIRIDFPKAFFFTHEKWFFFCFLYNNRNKRLNVFLDSEKIFNKVIEKHLDGFVIEQDFLKHEIFGESGEFSGQFTDLNIWSTILNDEDIKDLYSCEEIVKVPDVLEWKYAELVLGPHITPVQS